MKPESFLRLLALPHAWSPSHADWLNDLSSTPPVSVTIAALTFESADDPPRPPRAHAARPSAATATRPRPIIFLFNFILNTPPITCKKTCLIKNKTTRLL